MKNIIKILVVMTTMIAGVGCSDYAITTTEPRTEIVYVEVPGEVIRVPVPGPTEYGNIWVDHFIQPNTVDGVDILWIIDTSGSMSRYHTSLIAGIESMINSLPASGWRLAMMSNNPASAAIESQFPLVPGDDIDDAIDMFNAMGTGPMEMGFDAAYEYIVNNPYSQTWMRPDAALLVVFVSDEEEQSYQHLPAVSDFTFWYGGLRYGSAFNSSIVNVEPVDSICAQTPSSIDIGDRYMEATNYFGGVVIDICSEDWSAGVAEASSQIDPHEEWPLTYEPVSASTISVFTNGSLWDPANWYYDSADNKVKFITIPGPSTLVEIAYYYEDEDLDTGQ